MNNDRSRDALQTTVLDWVGGSENVKTRKEKGKAREHCLLLCLRGSLDSCRVGICKELSRGNRKCSACSLSSKKEISSYFFKYPLAP